jgi:hypothetical protein
MTVIAEQLLDLSGRREKTSVRLHAPERSGAGSHWTCRFEVGDPINYQLDVAGESSLQALALSLKALSAFLYSTELYRDGELGAFGEFGGYLGIPAPNNFLDIAPYPF